MIRTVITLLVSFLCISIYAQDTNTDKKVEIIGRVTTAADAEIEGAVIVATGVGGVAGATVTDSTGKFTVSVSLCDSLVVEISHLIYEDRTVLLSEISAPVDLGTIILSEKKESIQEAVVTSSFIKMRGTDMLVDVKGNPDAKGKNALQFLNTLPGINGLHIYGQGLSKVYINDRELKLPNDQLYSYVASLKAEDVQSIQIVTRKGAKYEAGHKGGVIRIRMSKSDNKRLSGTLSVPVSVNTYDGAITTDIPFMLNYTNGKLSSYTFASFHYMQNENTNSRQIYENREEWSKSDRTFMSMMLDQSLIYDISKRHSLGLALNGFFKPFERGGATSSSYTTNDEITLGTGNATLTYDWNIGDRGSNISFAGDYMYSKDKYTNIYESSSDYEKNTSGTDKNTYSVKLDGEYIFKDEISTLGGGLFYLGMDAGEDFSQANVSSRFDYNEAIYGAYVDFYSSFLDESLDLELGLRYESSDITWKYSENINDRVGNSDRHNSFFPTASLSYFYPNGKHYTSLSYERYIDRPTMLSYDPATYRSGDWKFSQGAIYLKPEFENSLSLTHTINSSHTLSLSYIWTKDIYDTSYKEENGNLIVTEDNVGSSRKAELYANTKFWLVKKWLYARLTGIFDYTGYISKDYGNTDTFNAYLFANLNLYLPKSWAIGVSGHYRSPSLSPTQRYSHRYGLDAAISKSINKKITLSLSARNILNNDFTMTSRISGVNYEYTKHSNFSTVTLTFAYNFGVSNFYAKKAHGNSDVRERSSGR